MSGKSVKGFDFWLLINMILIIIFSIILVSSATKTQVGLENYWEKQVVWFFIGLVLMLIAVYVDYNFIGEFSNYLYVINLFGLLAVRFLGSSSKGAQRWLNVGPIRLQPSEFAKIIIIVCLAKFIEKRADKINNPKELIKTLIYVAIPMGLIMFQPDLGTSLVFIAITIGMLFVAELDYRYILGALGTGIAAAPLMWFFVLKPYQKKRLLVFINPELDPAGDGYHVTQSKIAIGSGKVFGKGLYHGGFTQSNFLPERHTDFIFGVVGEEFGFIGAVIIVSLLVLLIMRCLKIANESKDFYGKLICIGVASMLAFQLLINAGMTMGIMPVTGIPLPFVSYGGSSLWINMMSIGLVLNVAMRRKRLKF
jgi:rod shape determining protein RodA